MPSPQNTQVLNPRTYKHYVICKRDFADVLKLKIDLLLGILWIYKAYTAGREGLPDHPELLSLAWTRIHAHTHVHTHKNDDCLVCISRTQWGQRCLVLVFLDSYSHVLDFSFCGSGCPYPHQLLHFSCWLAPSLTPGWKGLFLYQSALPPIHPKANHLHNPFRLWE